MNDHHLLLKLAGTNYEIMKWFDNYGVLTLALMLSACVLFRMSPMRVHPDHSFYQVVKVRMRVLMLFALALYFFSIWAMFIIYVANNTAQDNVSGDQYISWIRALFQANWHLIPLLMFCAALFHFIYARYVVPAISAFWKRIRVQQSNDKLDDIRTEIDRRKAKDFDPRKFYKDGQIFIGLDDADKPIYVSEKTWQETNMQLVGATRRGKGVVIGCIIDQILRTGNSVFYIDPKGDKFAPHIAFKSAKDNGIPFYFVDLSDNGYGEYAPFLGGTKRDALVRLASALGLKPTGSDGDFFKRLEVSKLGKAFAKSRHMMDLKRIMAGEDADRINAELEIITEVKSLCPPPGRGFDMDKAILEGAMVYVVGDLDDDIVIGAKKWFLQELIQANRRLYRQGKRNEKHITAIVDETKVMVSRTLSKALQTCLGFNMKFVLAYQSVSDIYEIDDITENGRNIAQSLNINSQVKAVYGGADDANAEWISKLSGTQIKTLPKMERSEINDVGGEEWGNTRYLGHEETPLISQNLVLALPPRVCVFLQPGELTKTCYTSFIAVEDEAPFFEEIEKLEMAQSEDDKRRSTNRQRRQKQRKKKDSTTAENTKQTIGAVDKLDKNPKQKRSSGEGHKKKQDTTNQIKDSLVIPADSPFID